MVETIEDVIVRRLTAERIEELKRLLKDTQEKYRYQLARHVYLLCVLVRLHAQQKQPVNTHSKRKRAEIVNARVAV